MIWLSSLISSSIYNILYIVFDINVTFRCSAYSSTAACVSYGDWLRYISLNADNYVWLKNIYTYEACEASSYLQLYPFLPTPYFIITVSQGLHRQIHVVKENRLLSKAQNSDVIPERSRLEPCNKFTEFFILRIDNFSSLFIELIFTLITISFWLGKLAKGWNQDKNNTT